MLITVSVNGVTQQIKSQSTLTSLQHEFDLPTVGCVFAINDQIIPKGLWKTQQLCEGDQISLFQAIAGG
ncbi:sulfur carrier protein ThiS [Vibrio ziniensis]|uniref:Sulfur carrier protein ThiS n=1 Tax=Vibrio ziniensis TaxID=2711221 RepID=A0A6G7CM15_9VIBR|nr:sulfur carrier protein ThiS [Vibrio ziniensis]QIH43110.1 sulfur carrier protein ThiS [Vibrio ziniensis]